MARPSRPRTPRRAGPHQRTLAWTALSVLLLAPAVRAQSAASTASRLTDIAVFGGYTNLSPDYAHPRNQGVTVGASATRYLHFAVKPGLDVRYTYSHGPAVNESSILIGPRGQMDFGRYHPYADYLVGHGFVGYNFANPTNPATGAFVQSVGGGVDVDVFRQFEIKADYQYHSWNLGNSYTLTPSVLTVGLAWRIPSGMRRDGAIH